jgi:type I restriction enzyme S subunit
MACEWPRLSLREANVALIDCDHRTPPASPYGYPYVTIPQLRNGRIELVSARRITPERFADWTRRAKPSPFDVVLSRRCNPGETAFVEAGAEFALGQNLVLLRADGTKVHPPYLRWLVRGPEWWDEISKYLNVGAVFDSLRCADIPKFELRIPPLPEQRAISDILGTLDDKIELNRRMSETLEVMARALFKSWFVDFLPVRAKQRARTQTGDPVRAKAEGRDAGLPLHIAELFPDSFEDSEQGEIPEGWEVTEVDSLCQSIASGGTPARMNPAFWENGRIPWFKTGELLDGPLLDSEEHITETALENSSCKLWPAGTILLALYASPTVGRLGVLTQPGTANQAAAGLIAKPAYGVPFLRRALLAARAKLQAIAVGAAQQNINQGVLKAHRVVIPNTSVAEVYARLVAPLDTRQVTLAEQSRALGALRDALLPKLISGELRTRPACEDQGCLECRC